MKLSIIIKARNEADNIASCLESALRVASQFGGEVILADCASDDRTVEIAKTYPVRIVQLKDPQEANCGIGPELGYRSARGDYVYLLDGDMTLEPDFVGKAIDLMEKDGKLAAVGGFIEEMRVSNLEFVRRKAKLEKIKAAGVRRTESLSGGGLFRRVAIQSLGYMSDRNLHAMEEYDLGTRLRQAGWYLMALPNHAANHYGYQLGTLPLLLKRLRGRNFLSQGELLRAAAASGYLGLALREVRAFRFSIAVIAFWLLVFAAAVSSTSPGLVFAAGVALTLLAGLLLGVSRGDPTSGLYSMLLWHLTAGGMMAGLLKRRRDPRAPIATSTIEAASATAA